jgi:hypothetical protein
MSSTQQQQVVVKAYYNDLGESQPEIRRFTVGYSYIIITLFLNILFLDRCDINQ